MIFYKQTLIRLTENSYFDKEKSNETFIRCVNGIQIGKTEIKSFVYIF